MVDNNNGNNNRLVKLSFETCFAAVNRCPNCIKWISSDHFVIAANRTIVIYFVGQATTSSDALVSFSSAELALNGHQHSVTCIDALNYQQPRLIIASGDKKGNVLLWKMCQNLSLSDSKFELVSKKLVSSLHKMSINSVKLFMYQSNLFMVTCGDTTIKISKISNTASFELDVETFSTVDLSNRVAFQADCFISENGSVFVAAGLDDCRLHLYLCHQFLPDDPTATKFRSVFKSEPFDDWIRGMSIVHLPKSNSTEETDVAKETVYIAVASQDSFIQIFAVYSPSVNEVESDSSSETLKRTKITNEEETEVLYTIYPESILSGHTDKVYSVQFLSYNVGDSEIGLLSSSFDRSVILWSYNISNDNSLKSTNNNNSSSSVWEDVARVGDVGGNDLGFYGAQISPDCRKIVAYNYTGSLLAWAAHCTGPVTSYSDLNWITAVTSSGHFYSPVDLCWNPHNEDYGSSHARFFATAGKDKIVRIFARVHIEDKKDGRCIWQEIGRPQVHGYEMNTVSLLNDVTLVSAGDEKVVRVFDCTSNFTHIFHNHSCSSSSSSCHSTTLVIPHNVNVSKLATVPSLGLSNKAVEVDSRGDGVEEAHKDSGKESFSELFSNAHLSENTLWGEKSKLYGHGNEVYCVTSFSSQDSRHLKLIASASKATSVETARILLWRMLTSSDEIELIDNSGGQGHTLTVTDLKFTHDANFLLSVSRDRSFCVFAVIPSVPQSSQIEDNVDSISYALCLQHKIEHHKRIIWKCCWVNAGCAESSNYKFITTSRDKTIAVWSFTKNPSQFSDWLKVPINNITALGDTNSLICKSERVCSQSFSQGVTAIDAVSVCNYADCQLEQDYWLVCVGLENGHVYLMKLDTTNNQFEFVHTFDLLCHAHVLDLTSIKFSCKQISKNDSSQLWLTTASNDCLVKLYRIEFFE